MVKMSMLALYHRIGSGQKGLPWVLQAKVIWGIAIAIMAFTVAVVLVCAQMMNRMQSG
jgi:hypothetical protein